MQERRGSSRALLYIVPGLILAASTSIKLSMLGARELWLDETYSAYAASLNLPQLVRFTAGDVHPPLYSFLLWGWAHLAGDTSVRLRLFSALINLCSMVAMLFLARRALGERFGGYAAGLYAFSPILFVYSLEVRSYMLFLLLLILLLSAHWRVAVEGSGSRGWLIAYCVLAAGLFYTHYVGVFLVAGLFMHWLVRALGGTERVARPCVAAGLVLLLVAPGVPLMFRQYHMKRDNDRSLEASWKNPAALSYGGGGAQDAAAGGGAAVMRIKGAATVIGVYPARSSLLLLVCAVPLGIALAGIVCLGWKGDEVCRLFGVVAVSVLAAVLLLHLKNTRYILSLIPVLVLALARVVQRMTESSRWKVLGWATGAALALLYLAGFWRQAFRPQPHPWQSVVAAVREGYRPGDKVVFDVLYAQVPFDYFAKHQGFFPQETGFPVSIYDWWGSQPHQAWGGPVILKADLDRFLAAEQGTRTLWLVRYETYYYDPQDALLEGLRRAGRVTEVPLAGDSDEEAGLRLVRVDLHE